MIDKVILVIDKPKTCLDCPVCTLDEMDGDYICGKTGKCVEEYFDKKPSWCPLIHPLKEVSNDFYIYDTEYLFKHLDREIDLLKSTERFKEYMRNREE